MAGGKLSGRQKMINMMYLVLMAMLALNVSKEILKSFHLFEQSFKNTNKSLQTKNDNQIASFQKQMEKNEGGSKSEKKKFEKANKIREISSTFVSYIEELKNTIVDQAGGRNEENEVKNADDMDHHATLLVQQDNGAKGKELEEIINKTRNDILAILKKNPVDSGDVGLGDVELGAIANSTGLHTNNDDAKYKTQSWTERFFEHTPAAGVVALLEKLQTDARNLESEAITALLNVEEGVTFDQFSAEVIAPSSAILVGGTYKAKVMLAAYSSNSNHKVVINGNAMPVNGGIAEYSVKGSGAGVKKWGGHIELKTPDGIKKIPFDAEYQVFQGGATIAADAMNVFYIGIPNPVSVSVPGFSDKDVNVSMSGGSISRSGKGYVVKPSAGSKTARISASVKVDGQTKSWSQEFRVKSVPRPFAALGALKSGNYTPGQIKVQANYSIAASMGESFILDPKLVKWNVTGYQIALASRRGPSPPPMSVNGGSLSRARNLLNAAKSGDQIIVAGISAVGPGGVKKILDPIVIGVK